MVISNYWLMLIWIFAGSGITLVFPKRKERLGNEYVERWDMVAAILLVIPYILWAGFRGSVGDTGGYRKMFLNLDPNLASIPEVLSSDQKDPGFTVLVILIKSIIGNRDVLFLTIIAAVQMLCLCFVYRKYSTDYWICIFLFVTSTDYISWVQNGMRQFLVVVAIFACFKWHVEKKYIPSILVILLTSLVHKSALLMIPILFIVQGKAWNVKTILMLLATMVIVGYVDRFTPILSDLLEDTQYDNMMTDELWVADDGTNILRVAVYSMPAILSLVGLRHVRAADDPVINYCVNCSIVTMALYLVSAVTSGVYIGRLPIYTTLQGYIVLPWLIDRMFARDSARLIKFAMIGLYAAFYYYQIFIAWGW